MNYLCDVTELLYNPVFNALSARDLRFAKGPGKVKYFDEAMSPFAGFETGYEKGFEELFDIMPPGANILYSIPEHIEQPKEWQLLVKVEGLQMVYNKEAGNRTSPFKKQETTIVPLKEEHIPQMVELATLTRPGPFGTRTIDFGAYHGIFEGEQLVAMTGQRLHVGNYSEVSAVCTHPRYSGKGYASMLVKHQVEFILEEGFIPFLHVRADYARAIEIYRRLGFVVKRNMNFYFMKSRKKQS